MNSNDDKNIIINNSYCEDSEDNNTRYIDYELDYITIDTPPTKTVYQVGECFNPAGMVVRAHYTNGTSRIITRFDFSPTGSLSLGTAYITIEYFLKTVNQPITVVAINCLIIEHAPNKTIYQVGDYFEPYGLVVRKYDSNGNGQLVTDYSFSPSSPLTSANNQITISHSGFTKTISISVVNSPVSGYAPHQYTKNALIGNNPFFNLFDLSALFVTNAISVSRDSYTLSFNLVYHSRMKDRLFSLCAGMPRRFKTNYHQFLVQDGLDNNNNPIYKYIDSDSFIHSFYQINSKLFYCRDNGLYLYFFDQNEDDYAKIVDSNSNELYFDQYTRLIRIVSGKNSSNIKHIVYNNGYISKVYDQRDSTTEIAFNYSNGLLNSVDFKYRGSLIKSLTFAYYSDPFEMLLTDIEESTPNNDSRILYSFVYNSALSNHSSFNRVESIEDYLSQKVYRMAYSFNYSLQDYWLDSLKTGNYNSNAFEAKEEITRVTSSFRSDSDLIISEVTIKNKNSKYFTYFLDESAHIDSFFECGGIFDAHYKTLYKETGLYIDIGGGGTSRTINGHGFYHSIDSYIIPFNGAALNYFKEYKNFVLRMYLRTSDFSSKRVKAILSGSNVSANIVNIDKVSRANIQLIEIPLTRLANNMTSLTLTLSFMNEDGNSADVDIADIYLCKKDKTTLCFNNGSYSFADLATIKIYNSPNVVNHTINNALFPYFTEQDLLNSIFLVKAHNILVSSGPNCLLLSHGQHFDQYSLSFVGVNQNNANIFMSTQLYNNSFNSSTCWYFLTESADGKVVTKTLYSFNTDDYEIRTRIITNDDSSTLQEEIKKYNYYNVLLEVSSSHIENSQILTSVTTYEYFANGELKKVSATDGTETIVLYQATQNNDGYINRKTSGLNSIDISYTNYLESTFAHNSFASGTLSSSGYSKSLLYDSYREEITSISHLYNDINQGTNGVQSDYYFNQTFLSLNGSMAYATDHSVEEDSLSFYRYNGTAFEEIILVQNNDESLETTIFGNSNDTVISINFDDYLRNINIELNEETKATFTYENNIESTYVSQVSSMMDNYISRYSYCSYNSVGCIETISYPNFAVQTFENGQVGYVFDNETYICAFSKEEVYVTYNSNRVENFSIEYHFDAFGRKTCQKRFSNYLVNNAKRVILSDNYSYYSNTVLPSAFYHKDYSNNDHVIEAYSYDGYGNLSSITTTFNNFAVQNFHQVTYNRSFSYDGFNRLTQETNSLISSFSKTYEYYNNGKTKFFGNNYCLYNAKGQLTSFGNTSFTYDKYGNRLTKSIGQHQESYEWSRGTCLSSLTINGQTILFSYDCFGRRYQKNTNKETVTYFYDKDLLIGEDHIGKTYYDNNNIQHVYPSFKLRFFYHHDGTPNGLRLISETANVTEIVDYVYIVNQFNEIVGLSLYDGSVPSNLSSSLKVNYIYDAWGKHKVYNALGQESDADIFIGYLNPLRYKGYYYDQETGLYYLTSRYYDPSVGQFISPDSFSYLDINAVSGYNLYAYCYNNPVMYCDPSGHDASYIIIGLLIGLGVGIMLGLGYAAYKDYQDNYSIDLSIGFTSYIKYALIGGLIGAAIGAQVGYYWPVIGSYFGTGVAFDYCSMLLSNRGIASAGTFIMSHYDVILISYGLGVWSLMAYKIPMHGEPNTKVRNGGSFGEYDSNGNLSYRVDTTGKGHYIPSEGKRVTPHIHKYVWKMINGVWRWIEEVLPYIL